MIPLVAMQFSTGVNWDETDFLVMGVLLFSVGLVLETIRTKVKESDNKIIIGFIVLGAFFLIWAELAVGIFNTPFAGS